MRRIAALGVVTLALSAGAGTLASTAVAAAPTATTGTTTNITDTRATLAAHGQPPEGRRRRYSFQYGRRPHYGKQTPTGVGRYRHRRQNASTPI